MGKNWGFARHSLLQFIILFNPSEQVGIYIDRQDFR